MVGQHRKPKSPWPRRIVTVGLLGGAYFVGASVGGYHGPDPGVAHEATEQPTYSSVAQRFALAVHQQLCGRPSLPQLLCAQATEVAANPIHDGKDGKDGKPGVDGVDGSNGANGRNGIDGSPARELILQLPDSIFGGAILACPHTAGSNVAPIYKCVVVKSPSTPSVGPQSN